MMIHKTVVRAVLTVGVLAGCQDKAEPGFTKCESLASEQHLMDAIAVCENAAAGSPESAYGQRAAQLVAKLRNERLEVLKRVRKRAKRRSGPHRDECELKGKPYKYEHTYSGGTYDEVGIAAWGDGCVPLHHWRGTDFCCPEDWNAEVVLFTVDRAAVMNCCDAVAADLPDWKSGYVICGIAADKAAYGSETVAKALTRIGWMLEGKEAKEIGPKARAACSPGQAAPALANP